MTDWGAVWAGVGIGLAVVGTITCVIAEPCGLGELVVGVAAAGEAAAATITIPTVVGGAVAVGSAIVGGALGDIGAYAWQNTDNGAAPSSCNDADSESPAISEANAGHIFRDSTGPMAEDTVANRALLRDSVRLENKAGSYNGIDTYTQLQSGGSQVWAEVRNGEITNGGVNRTPHTWDQALGKLRR